MNAWNVYHEARRSKSSVLDILMKEILDWRDARLFYGFESGFRQVETEARGVWMEKKGGEEIPSKGKKGQ